jgi:LVIVD repeat
VPLAYQVRFWGARAALVLTVAACAHPGMSSSGSNGASPDNSMSASAPNPDPRVGLKAGLYDAGTASWNMALVSTTPPSSEFVNKTNSDLAFDGKYVIQGSYNGFQVWDISNPSKPTLRKGFVCPASQSDVSVYKNLLFVSGEGLSGRLDCGIEGVKDTVSSARLRGLRIFDITDIDNPKNVGNVQTCRGSHTHTLLVDPHDKDNVYIYISGSSAVRSPSEMPGCVKVAPSQDPNSALFRIEVIKVPLAHPEQAAIVSSPRIFNDLTAPPKHGAAKEDLADIQEQKAKGAYTAKVMGDDFVFGSRFVDPKLDSIVAARGGTGAPTHADSAALRDGLQAIVDKMIGDRGHTGPTQCHDITVYPTIGLAGGACEGYGLLLDIHDPEHPVRLAAAADSNFSYWHSATFNNDGTKVLFTDEWGGGGQPKCRATDKHEWGADAIYTIVDQKLVFQSYYKMPAAQTKFENCVAHNGSLIPIPGRDIMVQSWYQGGVSVFDWTDAARPKEIAFFDRGPVDSTKMASGGTWSAYWYNGVIVSSEISRGLDIFALKPSAFISQNELEAAKSVQFDQFNTQGQPQLVWPASFTLARAYLDQLARSNGLAADQIAAARKSLAAAEKASGSARKDALTQLATQLDSEAGGAGDAKKTQKVAATVRDLAAATS